MAGSYRRDEQLSSAQLGRTAAGRAVLDSTRPSVQLDAAAAAMVQPRGARQRAAVVAALGLLAAACCCRGAQVGAGPLGSTAAARTSSLPEAGMHPRSGVAGRPPAEARRALARRAACARCIPSPAPPAPRLTLPLLPSFYAQAAQLQQRQVVSAAYKHMACQPSAILEPSSTAELATALAAALSAAQASGSSIKVRATHK